MPTYTVTRQDGYNSLMASWEQQNTEIASLREQLAAMTARAEAAEAALLDAQRMASLTPDDLYITPNALPPAQQQAESDAEYWREKRAEDRRAELVDRALDDMWTM